MSQEQQIQVQVKEVSLTVEEIQKLDAVLGTLPYRDVKPAYDVLNAAMTRKVNELAKEQQEKQAALKIAKEPELTTAEG